MISGHKPVSPRTLTVLGIAYFAGYIPLLAYIPYSFSTPEGVISEAAVSGYSNEAAYLLASGWTVLGLVMFFLAGLWDGKVHPATLTSSDTPASARALSGRQRAIEVAGVVALVLLAYWPWFLTRYGGYIEDHIFLTALHRMEGGLRPYADFEFLYGPLMIYLARAFTGIFGYSMLTVYSYIALLEAVVFATLVLALQSWLPDWRRRMVAIMLTAPLLINALFGPNWSATRRLLAVSAVVLVAARPASIRHVLIASLLLGLQLAYSHDFGIAGLASVLAILGFIAILARQVRFAYLGVLSLTGAVVTWYLTSRAVLGNTFQDYLSEIAHLTSRFSAGEAGFRFYWTANSLAAIGLLSISVVMIGFGSGRQWKAGAPNKSDLLLIGGLTFAFVGLKSGLNRADVWHLDAPMILLVLALCLADQNRMFQWTKGTRGIALSLIGILTGTFLLGNLPSASYLAQGWASGLKDAVFSVPATRGAVPNTRAPIIEIERSHPDPTHLELAEYLATPQRASRPILFYSTTWPLGKQVGVFKEDFANDDFLYSNERGEQIRQWLEARPEALVIMYREVHDRLFEVSDPSVFPEFERQFQPSITKSLAARLSTVHFSAVRVENELKENRWKDTVGSLVLGSYDIIAEFGPYVVLASREAG